MHWQPIQETDLVEMLLRAQGRMGEVQRKLWDAIRIAPVKWQLEPWGNEGGGFWVVAIRGQLVVWYNDIEEGFNQSFYTTTGVIDEYSCNQDELDITIERLLQSAD